MQTEWWILKKNCDKITSVTPLAKEEETEEAVIRSCLIIPDGFVVLENYFTTILSV